MKKQKPCLGFFEEESLETEGNWKDKAPVTIKIIAKHRIFPAIQEQTAKAALQKQYDFAKRIEAKDDMALISDIANDLGIKLEEER